MLCLKTFTEKTLKDFPLYGDWETFIEENYKYGRIQSTVFDWIGEIEKPGQLPSYHPYWMHICWLEKQDRIKTMLCHYKECLKDPEVIRFYFGYKGPVQVRLQIKQMLKENKKYKNLINY